MHGGTESRSFWLTRFRKRLEKGECRPYILPWSSTSGNFSKQSDILDGNWNLAHTTGTPPTESIFTSLKTEPTFLPLRLNRRLLLCPLKTPAVKSVTAASFHQNWAKLVLFIKEIVSVRCFWSTVLLKTVHVTLSWQRTWLVCSSTSTVNNQDLF